MPELIYKLNAYYEVPGLFLGLIREHEEYEDFVYTDWNDDYLVHHIGGHIMDMYGDDDCLAVITN